ncbi:winged helix-turn-helix domain-containing protein [Vibrio cholerae]|uniref:winged helix-turn-helix domain-containing protein n=1 Tax=Vibrio cholerae TaxID=666 RepID=UPI002946AA9A|nr:helix-turn-helix domain-containing protein [Vibrio vulnificus]
MEGNYKGLEIKIDTTQSAPTIYLKATGQKFSVSQPESRILQCLLEQQRIVPKDELLQAGWGRTEHLGEGSLPVAISNLRKVLKTANIDIINKPRVGYKIKQVDTPSPAIEIGDRINNNLEHSVINKKTIIIDRLIANVIIIFLFTLLFLLLIDTFNSWVYVSCNTTGNKEICKMEEIIYDVNK